MKSTTLIVMRHAKSNWNSATGADFDRMLSERGRNDAPLMGDWIVRQGLTPDKTICSTAERVKETIGLSGAAWNLSEKNILWEPSIYNASLSTLLGVVADDIELGQTNLLTGHNPGVSELILYLAGDTIPVQAEGNLMPTAALTVLKLINEDNIIDYHSWNIASYMKPALLPR